MDGPDQKSTTSDADPVAAVRHRYGQAALQVARGGAASCCGPACCSSDHTIDPVTRDLYETAQRSELPEAAVRASLGCGNPTALATLQEGETVLDLGSGGGIDVLLSAKRVGPTGKVYGLDMTDEMLALARTNAARAGACNVEFLKGQIESIPLPDASVDVIISNCVINLSADKGAVLREAFRVLKPGGRFAVSDVIVRGELPSAFRRNLGLWVGCLAGALEEQEFVSLLRETGFESPSIEPTREYSLEDAAVFVGSAGLASEVDPAAITGHVLSAFVRATKPSSAT